MMSQSHDLPAFPFPTPDALDSDPEGARLRAECEVARVRFPDGKPAWAALSYAAARQVLIDPRFSTAATARPEAAKVVPAGGDPLQLHCIDPPEHTRVRGLVNKAFSARAVERLRPWIDQLVDELIDALMADGQPADYVRHVAMPLPLQVICRLLGVPYDDWPLFRGWTERMWTIDADSLEDAMSAIKSIHEYFDGMLDHKGKHPGDDLTSRLLEVMSPREQVLATLQIIMGGGHETTLNHLGNSLLTLFRHPDQLRLLVEQPDLVPNAVEELLRYTKLGFGSFPRVATEDLELGGTTIRAGESVVAATYPANRDPAAFSEPEKLCVTRTFEQPHLGFGHGTHFCLGAQLARVELRAALAAVLRKLPGIRLAVDESELRWRTGGFIRGLQALPVAW